MKKLLKMMLSKKSLKSNAVKVKNVFSLKGEDAGRGIIRVHSALIKTPKNPKGVFERHQMVTLRNATTGEFVTREVLGAGSNYKLFPGTVALDYDAQQQLGEFKDCDLGITLAWWLEREFFMCFQETDRAAREGRKNNIMFGTLLTAIGIVASVVLTFA